MKGIKFDERKGAKIFIHNRETKLKEQRVKSRIN